MDSQELPDKLRALRAKATQGHWQGYPGSYIYSVDSPFKICHFKAEGLFNPRAEEDFEYICELHNALPELLERVETRKTIDVYALRFKQTSEGRKLSEWMFSPLTFTDAMDNLQRYQYKECAMPQLRTDNPLILRVDGVDIEISSVVTNNFLSRGYRDTEQPTKVRYVEVNGDDHSIHIHSCKTHPDFTPQNRRYTYDVVSVAAYEKQEKERQDRIEQSASHVYAFFKGCISSGKPTLVHSCTTFYSFQLPLIGRETKELAEIEAQLKAKYKIDGWYFERKGEYFFLKPEKKPSDFISIEWQKGTRKEKGVNGACVEDVIKFAYDKLREYNLDLPCLENKYALCHLKAAIDNLGYRTQNRQEQGVEGTMKPHES